MLLIKEKLNDNWTRAHVAKYFNGPEYMVCEACELAREKGLLALPETKRGKCLSKELDDSARLFYGDDESLWLMPGAKNMPVLN